jgi:plasmid rolling circle replication initiator protein Rep
MLNREDNTVLKYMHDLLISPQTRLRGVIQNDNQRDSFDSAGARV